MQGDDIGQLNCRVPLTIRLRETKQGKDTCAYSEDITWKAPIRFHQNCTQLAEDYRSGALFPPDYTIWCQPWGMAEDRATDSRYHDVAGMDEKKDLFRQLRTVFSIVGK